MYMPRFNADVQKQMPTGRGEIHRWVDTFRIMWFSTGISALAAIDGASSTAMRQNIQQAPGPHSNGDTGSCV